MLTRSLRSLFDQKVLGGIFLIVGTCLGGGMLALPISNSTTGFMVSTGYLFATWFAMTICSYMILEVNLLFAPGTNLLTMAGATLGRLGQSITLITYFALLYNLLSAYISGGSGVIITAFNFLGITISDDIAAIIFVAIFGYIVFSKMHRLDTSNRIFIFLKLLLFISIVFLSLPAIELNNLLVTNSCYSKGIIMILCASFGYGVVIPSLRKYLDNDPLKLRVAVIAGSILPLFVYIVWDSILMGSLGTEMLLNLHNESQPTNRMISIFSALVDNKFAVNIFHIFTALCIITSFLGIALSMSDFLSDSLSIEKKGISKAKLFALTFLPPLAMVLWFKEGFIAALQYAGFCCIILHIFLPILMTWVKLDRLKYNNKINTIFKIISLILLIVFTIVIYINLTYSL